MLIFIVIFIDEVILEDVYATNGFKYVSKWQNMKVYCRD